MSLEIRQEIISVLMELRPKEIAIFGSYASGQQKKDSDIDILIEFHKAPIFFEIVRTIKKLEDKIDTKVDLVDVHGVSKEFLEAVTVYAINIYSDVKRSA